MHILIDVQGLQSASRYRGVGRSTLAMSKAIIRNADAHRVSILLNGMFSLENIRKVRQTYQNVLPYSEIFTFSAQGTKLQLMLPPTLSAIALRISVAMSPLLILIQIWYSLSAFLKVMWMNIV